MLFVDESDQGFGRENRLRRRRDIDRVFREGTRRDVVFFSFRVLHKSDPGPRLLVVTGKKLGNAVVRNRVRRAIREGFRTHKEMFAHLDVVVLPRPEVGQLRSKEIAEKFLAEFQEVEDAAGDIVDQGGLRAPHSGAGKP